MSWIGVATIVVAVGAAAVNYEQNRKAQSQQAKQIEIANEQYQEQMEITRQQLAALEQDRALWEDRTEEQRANYQETMEQMGGILKGETQIEDSPMFASQFAQLQKGFDQKKNEIMETYPEGGRRDRALKELSRSFADVRQSFSGDVQKQVFNWAAGMGLPTGKPNPAVGFPSIPGGVSGMSGGGVDVSGLTELAGYYSKNEPKTTTPEKSGVQESTFKTGPEQTYAVNPPTYSYNKV
uniref:Uncharacterized protein n=1 Tax=viral metagenome TaxID=1070528 RepID=A0A6M3KEG7_9ZZZZ